MFLGTRGPGGIGIGSGSSQVDAGRPFDSGAACRLASFARLVAEAIQRGLLLAFEALLAQRQLVEVDQVAVEIGAVHAGELHLAADGDAARSAHARAVDHDRIEADDGRDAERAAGLAARLHHRDGADGDHFADVLFALQDFGERVGDEALAAVAAVIGGDDQFVALVAELVFPEDEIAVAESDDRDGAVALLLVLAQLRVDGRDAQSAADQHNRPVELADVAGQPERSDEIEDRVAFAQRHHFQRGLADSLDYDRDGALTGVEIRHGERDPFPMLIDASHDKMAGARSPRDVGRVDVPEKGGWAELFSTSDEKHYTPPTPYSSRISEYQAL